jgi:hypothetical protein
MMIRICEWFLILSVIVLIAPYVFAASIPGVAVSLKPWIIALVLIVDLTGVVAIALVVRGRPSLSKAILAIVLVELLITSTVSVMRMDDFVLEITARSTAQRIPPELGL